MGEQEVELQHGDRLVGDNLKLHHVVGFPGFDTRAFRARQHGSGKIRPTI